MIRNLRLSHCAFESNACRKTLKWTHLIFNRNRNKYAMEWRAHKLDNEIPRINRAGGSPWNVPQHVICCGKRKNRIMPCKWDCYFAIETQSLYLSATSKNTNNNILHRSRDILKISLMSLALVVRWSKKQVDCVRTFIRYQPKFIFDNTIWICIWISIKNITFSRQ